MGRGIRTLEGLALVAFNAIVPAQSDIGSTPRPDFWRNKRVLITGHTGFKGGWLALWLSMLGAKVSGYALAPHTEPNFFTATNLQRHFTQSHFADINDYSAIRAAISSAKPDIIMHLAAQPLVRRSYLDPLETYRTNVMGTAHLLQAARSCSPVQAVVVVTSDKCYENQAWPWGYRETDSIGGHDPYSSSKACQELVVSAFRQSYQEYGAVALATARAGNVIGGGDWSDDRLIPDAIRAYTEQTFLRISNPQATRPWQHVLEPLAGYLMLAEQLCANHSLAGAWNFGPQDSDVRTVGEVVKLVSERLTGGLSWQLDARLQPHEARLLKLDCSKSQSLLGWKSRWALEQALTHTCDWYSSFYRKRDMDDISQAQIASFSLR